MCAINGFNFKDEVLIRKMNEVTSHRGPDDTGIFLDEDVSLGHNRLSIIDLSDSAAQPMKSDDGNLIIVFNGEIYNFKEIKKQLMGVYQFRTRSDTEVVLAAYKQWGSGCVKKLNGIFAFAIWDKAKKEFFLARDHIGVKPLYYFCFGGRLIFSSEIKAILKHSVGRILNKGAFDHYLRVLYVPEPLTMFERIYKLPPASYAVFSTIGGKNNDLKITKYWETSTVSRVTIDTHQGRSLEEELRGRIFKAVEGQLVSDKSLGVYLSGGIDSSIILYNMAKMRNKIDTFSVGFELESEEQKEKFNADFNLARRTAKHYGANHHEVLLSPRDVKENLLRAVWHMDEPISNPTAIAMIKLASFAKNKADVVLGGDGGDELFGGYERYRLSLISSYYQRFPKIFRAVLDRNKKFEKLNTPAGIERFALFMFQKDNILKRVMREEVLGTSITKDFFDKKYFSGDDDGGAIAVKRQSHRRQFEEVLMDTDRKSWLVDFSLMLTDKMTMSQGLEARVPFLDKDLVEFASAILLRQKVSMFNTKILLKSAFKGHIPDFLFREPKRGWFSPGAKWLRNKEIEPMTREILDESYYGETSPLFNWSNLKEIVTRHKSGEEYNLNIIWAILTFQIWAKRFNIRL